MNKLNVQKEITRIIGKLIINQPVIGAINLRMKYVSAPIPLTTPGVLKPFSINPVTNTITYDEEQLNLIRKQGQDIDLMFILAHEAMHVLTGSLLRKGDRDSELWNIATDFEINYLLKDMKFNVPSSALYSSKFHN